MKLRAHHSERNFAKSANRSMERRKTDIQNPEKYFDFAVPQKSVENFRLEKLK